MSCNIVKFLSLWKFLLTKLEIINRNSWQLQKFFFDKCITCFHLVCATRAALSSSIARYALFTNIEENEMHGRNSSKTRIVRREWFVRFVSVLWKTFSQNVFAWVGGFLTNLKNFFDKSIICFHLVRATRAALSSSIARYTLFANNDEKETNGRNSSEMRIVCREWFVRFVSVLWKTFYPTT